MTGLSLIRSILLSLSFSFQASKANPRQLNFSLFYGGPSSLL
jgi:hypothetical protein